MRPDLIRGTLFLASTESKALFLASPNFLVCCSEWTCWGRVFVLSRFCTVLILDTVLPHPKAQVIKHVVYKTVFFLRIFLLNPAGFSVANLAFRLRFWPYPSPIVICGCFAWTCQGPLSRRPLLNPNCPVRPGPYFCQKCCPNERQLYISYKHLVRSQVLRSQSLQNASINWNPYLILSVGAKQ